MSTSTITSAEVIPAGKWIVDPVHTTIGFQVTDTSDPVANALNGLPKHVASRTLREVAWEGSTLIEGDVVDYVAELKRRPGRECRCTAAATSPARSCNTASSTSTGC